MSISYYILDDASHMKRPLFAKQCVIEQFDDLHEALSYYRKLPDTREKVLGLSDGICVLELVRCVPLFEQIGREQTSFPLIRDDIRFGPSGQRRFWRWRSASRS